MSKDTIRVVVVAEFQAVEGKAAELQAALHSLIAATTSEPGCIRYELNQRVDDERRISFIEKWKDRKAFDEHCQMPYIKHFFDAIRPQLVESFEVKHYQEILP